ncbi:MAG: adenylate/guanylate cyclase domain-containing protein [Nitrospirota bacterium]
MLRSPRVACLLGSTMVAGIIIAARQGGYLESWELGAYDLALRFHPPIKISTPPIVLVGITEDDITRARWPLTDGLMAKLLEKIATYQPHAIGVDIYRNFPVPPGREALDRALASHPEIVMVTKFGRPGESSVPPTPGARPEQVGFNDLLIDRDGVVRRGLIFIGNDNEEQMFSFSLRLALLHLQALGITPQPDPTHPEYLRLGAVTFRPFEPNDGGYVDADARGYQTLLDFRGGNPPIQAIPMTTVLSEPLDPAILKDKIVLVGVIAESVPDLFHTPLSAGLGPEERGIYGAYIHAYTTNQFLRAAINGVRPIGSLSDVQEAIWISLWTLLGGMIAFASRSVSRFVVLTSTGLVVIIGVSYLALMKGLWLPSVPPALGWLVSAALLTAFLSSQEKVQRALLMQLFSRHVSPEVAETIWQQRELFWDGGRPRSQKMTITVLFTDLENFTPMAEKLDPQELMEWMNNYIEKMAQLVMQYGGVVDDYFGDAIKANFGTPVARVNEAEIRQDTVNAVNCALAMQTEMNRLHIQWQEQNLPTVRMRIGIFTGLAVAGSLGSSERLKYTTIGDTVNIAARLESYEKDSLDAGFGDGFCRILIGEATLRYLGDRYQTSKVGLLSLKGKEEKIAVYRLIGLAQLNGDMTKEVHV